MIIDCKQCFKKFKPIQRKNRHSLFCSRDCYNQFRTLINIRFCKKCGIETKNKIFCSQSCNALFNNKGLKGNCLHCYKTISASKKFCNIKCNLNFKYDQRVLEILAGKVKNPLTLKRYLINTCGYKCSSCSNVTWMNKPIPLELEHVDGNYLNNNIDNLKLLCPNCHALTPTYKAKNKGNGRSYRRTKPL